MSGKDAERFHFSVKVTSVETQGFGGTADIALMFFELSQNVVPLGCLADLAKAGESRAGSMKALAVMEKVRGEMSPINPLSRDHDHEPFDQVL